MREYRHGLEQALRRRSCPEADVERLLQEIEDHAAELHAEARAQGLSPAQAQAWTEQKLGAPATIAHCFFQLRQHRDWWGRHPRLLFGLGPVLVFILGFAGAMLLLSWVGNFEGWWPPASTLSPETHLVLSCLVPVFYFVLLLVIPMLACGVAGYYGFGWKWALVACLMLSLHCTFHFIRVDFPLSHASGQIVWGYGASLDLSHHLWKGLPPLLIFGFFFLQHRIRLGNRRTPNPILS